MSKLKKHTLLKFGKRGIIYRYELSKEKGSSESKEGVFTISPTSPIKITGKGSF